MFPHKDTPTTKNLSVYKLIVSGKLAKEAEKNAKNGNPISYDEAKILDEWAKEYNVPQHHPAEVGSGQHFPGGNYMDHTHIYNIYVPYEYR